MTYIEFYQAWSELVMQNCIEKSKNVRECIFNSKPTFEKAELEHIKFQ